MAVGAWQWEHGSGSVEHDSGVTTGPACLHSNIQEIQEGKLYCGQHSDLECLVCDSQLSICVGNKILLPSTTERDKEESEEDGMVRRSRMHSLSHWLSLFLPLAQSLSLSGSPPHTVSLARLSREHGSGSMAVEVLSMTVGVWQWEHGSGSTAVGSRQWKC